MKARDGAREPTLTNRPTLPIQYISSHHLYLEAVSSTRIWGGGIMVHFSISLSLFLLLPLWCIGHPWNALFHFSFLILSDPKTVGRTPWTGNQPVARPLPTQETKTQNNRHICLEWFEPTIPVFEGAKAVHALDRAATVICFFSV
jgi:hypothetical protein